MVLCSHLAHFFKTTGQWAVLLVITFDLPPGFEMCRIAKIHGAQKEAKWGILRTIKICFQRL